MLCNEIFVIATLATLFSLMPEPLNLQLVLMFVSLMLVSSVGGCKPDVSG